MNQVKSTFKGEAAMLNSEDKRDHGSTGSADFSIQQESWVERTEWKEADLEILAGMGLEDLADHVKKSEVYFESK